MMVIALRTIALIPFDSTEISFVCGLLEDQKGRLWIGMRKGLAYLQPESGQFKHFQHDPKDSTSLKINFIADILEDSRGDPLVC